MHSAQPPSARRRGPAADPGESTNLATRRPRVVKEMLRELLRVMGEVGDALPPEASALLKA